jgi:DNA polymerase delta subunit 1
MPAFARKLGSEYKIYGGQVPMMRLYGVTEDGHSVVAHIHGYEPYFFVQVSYQTMPVCVVFPRCELKANSQKRTHTQTP